MRVKRTIPFTIEAGTEEIRMRMRRFVSSEWAEFSTGFRAACFTSPQMKMATRNPEGPEQERKELTEEQIAEEQEEGDFVIPDLVIVARRISELDKEQRATFDRELKEYEEHAAEFLEKTCTEFVTVEPGQIVIEEDDGSERDVTEGKDLGLVFGSRPKVLQAVVWAIWKEHALSDEAKNALTSQSDSLTSLDTRKGVGETPAPVVAPVEKEDSAANAAVTAQV